MKPQQVTSAAGSGAEVRLGHAQLNHMERLYKYLL
jgi:hypothetical protein